MAGDALADKEFASITGPAGEGTLFTFGPDPRNKPTAKAIVEKFKAKNIDPEGYTLYTYAAMQVWSDAVKKAGTIDPKKVMDVIKAGSWDTVIGTLQYDAKGDIKEIDYVVYKWDPRAVTPRSVRRRPEGLTPYEWALPARVSAATVRKINAVGATLIIWRAG